MNQQLYENKAHGTPDSPYVQYHLYQVPHPFQIPVHWHREIEIIYVRSGTVNVTISGENYAGTPGDIFVVNPGELHLMGNQNLDADYFAFVFPLDLISFQTDDYLENHYLLPLRSGTIQILPQMPDAYLPQLDEICQCMISEHEKKRSDLLTIRIELLRLFLFFINHDLFTTTPGRVNSMDKEMITYIRQNYMNPISLADLSNQFHLSEKYLSRYFKEHFQLPFTQYLRHLRLTNAKTLLVSTDLPITQIALQCGFFNVSYFIRAFKETYKCSPLKYRMTKGITAFHSDIL